MEKISTKVSRMKRVFAVSAVMLFVLTMPFLSGCHKKVTTKPEAVPPQTTEQPGSTQQQTPEKVTERPTESVSSRDLTATDGRETKEGMFADILFEYDKYDVNESYKSELQSISAWMTKNPTAKLSVEGHCDERGTNEYNLALGDRRAKTVRDLLVSMGVPASRIETISYGEEKPLCTESNENCWAKNRRAHFVILVKAGK